MSEEVKRSFKWLVYWSWQRRGIRHRWTLKGITMVSTCYDRTLKCTVRCPKWTQRRNPSILETTENRQTELGFEIFCVGGGEHSPFFIFFSPRGRCQIPGSIWRFAVLSETPPELKSLPFRAQMIVLPSPKFIKPPLERTFYSAVVIRMYVRLFVCTCVIL